MISLVEQHLVAAGAVKRDDRHAPVALAGDAPVRPLLHHVADALFAPGRDPAHLADRFQRLFAETVLIERDEPLRRGAEDDRVVAAPAVRIGMVEILGMKQHAGSRA